MAWRIEQIVTLVGCRTPDIETWIAQEWLRPVRDESGWVFAEADLARARLIRDLLDDMAIETETVPVVLSLLDQNHRMRRQMRALMEAIGALPSDMRGRVLERLGHGTPD